MVSKIDARLRKIVHALHRPVVDQVLRNIREMQQEMEREVEAAVRSGRRTWLDGPADRDLGSGIVIRVTKIGDQGSYLKIRVDWPSGGACSLLMALLEEQNIAVGAFPPRGNGKYVSCCIDGASDELVSEYTDLPKW